MWSLNCWQICVLILLGLLLEPARINADTTLSSDSSLESSSSSSSDSDSIISWIEQIISSSSSSSGSMDSSGAKIKATSKSIDPDTEEKFHIVNVPSKPQDFPPGDANGPKDPNVTDGTQPYHLIFSDEFNDSKRTFESGFDKKWVALDHLDTTNMGQHYFSSQAVQVDKGALIITTSKPEERFHGAKYVSGSVQTWNKFCFTGGFVEIKAVLPGKWGIPGTWPAMWIMGNIGRATYLGSQDGTWPWSFDQCAPWIEAMETKSQKISACGNLTEKGNPHSRPEDYGLNKNQGRGATEIDILEVQIKARDEPAFLSTSLQISPGLDPSLRPASTTLPGKGQWYQHLKYGQYTSINSDYYGENGLDSLSAVTRLNTDVFEAYHIYRIDWMPGPSGYLRWWIDGLFLYEIPGESLYVWSNGVPPRQIPVEPSYLILSTAVSEKFSPPCEGQICDSIWPSNFTIDYVRVYQGPQNNYTSIGCSPDSFPTTSWIKAHPVDYGLPWYSIVDVQGFFIDVLILITAILSIDMVIEGNKHAKFYTVFINTFLWITVFHSLFGIEHLQGLQWIHVSISVLCGIVIGILCSLMPTTTLGSSFGVLCGCLIGQFLSINITRVLILCLFLLGGVITFLKVNEKLVQIVSTSLFGSFGIVISLSHLWFGSKIMENTWNIIHESILGLDGDSLSMCSQYCISCYTLLVTFFLVGIFLQSVTQKSLKRKSVFNNIQTHFYASADARNWRPDDGFVEKDNYFNCESLPPSLKQFSSIKDIGENIQRIYGFQFDNVRNQTEHIIVLLSNAARYGHNPYTYLHQVIFSNYSTWCFKLNVAPVCANIQTLRTGQSFSIEEISIDLCIYFFIWGEASNLRHSPEFLLFLFHKMKYEYGSIKRYSRPPGYFLDTTITPLYALLKVEMGSKSDHVDRKNYDDFNEFFWRKDCLGYDYKCDNEYEGTSPAPIQFSKVNRDFGSGINGDNDFNSTRQYVGNAFANAKNSKTYFEKRNWVSPLRTFHRIYEFNFLTFQLLVALAFSIQKEYDLDKSLQVISSILITPFFFGLLWTFVDMFTTYHKHVLIGSMVRIILRSVFYLFLTAFSTVMYWYAWVHGNLWNIYYTTVLILELPLLLECAVQFFPGIMTMIRTSKSSVVRKMREFADPLNRLYVGDNVLDHASDCVEYQFFWVSMIAWKLFFSYKFEIAPLITPTLLLYADHIDNDITAFTTTCLIIIEWIPFILVYWIDITIWHALWQAFAGTFVGFSLRIGEIRNFDRVRRSFSAAADAFNTKLISRKSKTGVEIQESSASYGSLVGNEVLDKIQEPSSSGGVSDTTPLLSFSRRKQSASEMKRMRRQKWVSFSVAWNSIIDTMRSHDLLSNYEKSILEFHTIPKYQREIYLPQFQLAGCFEQFSISISELFKTNSSVSEKRIQDKILDTIGTDPMVGECVEEIWELTNWVLNNLLGPCHTNDIKVISAILHSWSDKGYFRAFDFRLLSSCGRAFSELLQLYISNMSSWKSSAKFVPVKKSPSDYPSYQFSNSQSSQNRSGGGGMTKSASTTGLSSLGGKVPRRSRGAGVARIAAMQQATKPVDPNRKSVHSIPSPHIMQIRDKMRTFLNLLKRLVKSVDESDMLYSDNKAVLDRLTWILTQERGFMWDDDYTGEQLTLAVFEENSSTIFQHLYGLLTLRKIDAQPKSPDARRRLLFFVNSLFMDMPLSPLLEEMKSWTIMTPFYGEDVLYSKSDLESKRDGLDVHTLLYLQTLYKRDWQNFLERVRPKKNIWKDPQAALELRLWASLRGQTLARTVQGMMYSEVALRLLAQLEKIPENQIDDLVNRKFNYVVACQIYGRQKRNNDQKAKDIEYLLHRFKNLRVAYIDEIRVNYQKEQSYFAVLIKGSEDISKPEEVYRVRLPGNPILGEGKPENQNSAIIFSRGEHLQTIDMNQDAYLEECFKMRNLLEEFDSGSPDRPYTIVGLPEHIFTGSVSSLANYMALQETSFVTLGQRALARPLRVRLHYGHPDVFNKLFFMTRGGISKASKGINLSEDIFAGYRNSLRGGSVTFPEYVKCGKGRDVGMQQIYKFEAKLAQGAAEQSLSRDVYRLSQRLDFFKLLSFYYNHVGFYLSTSFVIWTVYVMVYFNEIKSLLGIETVGERNLAIFSTLQVMLGGLGFCTTAPLLATISVERGFKAAIREVLVVFFTGGPLYFLFHIGTKWFYFGQTILVGGAKYRATGRGFVTKHTNFDELYRFYASSHLYCGVEMAAALIIYGCYTQSTQYFQMTWSLWLVVFSWVCSPFWFNPLAFEWSDVLEDARKWYSWMRGDGGNPNQSWEAWFKDENSYFIGLRRWSKLCVALKGLIYAIVGCAILSANNKYHSLLNISSWLPAALIGSILLLYVLFSNLFLSPVYGETGASRFMKLILTIATLIAFAYSILKVEGTGICIIAFYYFGAAVGQWSLLLVGSDSKSVTSLYFIHDILLGCFGLSIITLLSALYVPGKIQTWLLYNNALSRGVVIEDILRANSSQDDRDDDMSLQQMRHVIMEQQKVISALTRSGESDARLSSLDENERKDDENMSHPLSETNLAFRNVSDNELSNLKDATDKLQAIVFPPSSPDATANYPPQGAASFGGGTRMHRSHSNLDTFAGNTQMPSGLNNASKK